MATGRRLSLEILPGRFAIWRLAPEEEVPDLSGFFSLTCVGSDRSVVLAEEEVPTGAQAAGGYRCLRLQGEFPLEETGVLAQLSAPLAESGIPLIVISTFTTDYLLLREVDMPMARNALSSRGIQILPPLRANH